MILLADLVDHYRNELERLHGHELLPSHHNALNAIRRCRNQYSAVMLLECTDCHQNVILPHSCGHRSCPHCQQHESQEWLKRQRSKLLPVRYFLITFTMPAQLRSLFWNHQHKTYDLLLKTAWQTIDSFSRRDRKLKGRTGAHAVLHTHNRRLDYHPHVHLIVPAGAINQQSREWREKKGKVLFWANNLARVFRAKWFEALRLAGLRCEEQLPNDWVVDCTDVGHGEQALVYLGRYLYRGVLPEKNIIADTAGEVSFSYKDNRGQQQIRTMPGGEFLWLLLRHVLPRRFRRVRDFGILHANCKRLVQLLQLVLRVPMPSPRLTLQRSPVLCQSCGKAMTLIARMLRITDHQLC